MITKALQRCRRAARATRTRTQRLKEEKRREAKKRVFMFGDPRGEGSFFYGARGEENQFGCVSAVGELVSGLNSSRPFRFPLETFFFGAGWLALFTLFAGRVR